MISHGSVAVCDAGPLIQLDRIVVRQGHTSWAAGNSKWGAALNVNLSYPCRGRHVPPARNSCDCHGFAVNGSVAQSALRQVASEASRLESF